MSWILVLMHTALLLRPSECEKKTLLIGGIFPMSGGWAGGIGCKPATKLALLDVNKNDSLLVDYELKLIDVDSMCQPGLSLKLMYELLYDNQTKLVLLSGCSSVSTFVAQAAKMWNLIVLSYGSSSPALSDKTRFPTFFRTHPSATLHNPTRLRLFKEFNWTSIAILQQTEEVFTSTIKDLEEVIKEESLTQDGKEPIEITVRQSFQTDPTNAVRSLKRQDARIIVGVFYEDMARKVFCQAYKEKLYGKKYVWLIIGWYPDLWYTKEDHNIDCTPDQLREALEGHLTTEVVMYNMDRTKITDTGINTDTFTERLEFDLQDEIKSGTESLSSLAGYVEAPLAYDAIWALSFALNKTISELKIQDKTLEDFDYQDNITKDAILSSLNRTDFEGVSGRVAFTSTGDRIAKTQIEQMQNGSYVVVGVYDYVTDELVWHNKDHWEGGKPPADRTIVQDQLRIISRPMLYIIIALSCAGVTFSIVSLFFNICSLKYSTIYNSLPILNSVIAVGCVLCLTCVTLFGMDGEWVGKTSYTTLCQVRTWLLSLGFTMSYGTMFVKVLYGWRISRKAKQSKNTSSKMIHSLNISQVMPYSMLITLLAVDVIVLAIWQGVDPLHRQIDYFDLTGPSEDKIDIMYRPFLEHCSCLHMTKWIGVVYGYKGALLIVGLFLAYETRNVKIRQINDLRFVAMAVYNIVVLCLIAVPVTFIIPNQQNANYAFISVAIILSCYLTVGLLFIPKMVPIFSRRLDMDEQDTQQTLLHQEKEKRFAQLKTKNDDMKFQISQKEKRIRELHAVLQKKFTSQLNSDNRHASDSAFSEEHTDKMLDSSESPPLLEPLEETSRLAVL